MVQLKEWDQTDPMSEKYLSTLYIMKQVNPRSTRGMIRKRLTRKEGNAER
jgi:hypothetical protein